MTPDLYNEAIVAEAKTAAGAGRLERPTVGVLCDNPLCGDRVGLELEVRDGSIAALGHVTRGCLLTRASASLLARHVTGRPIQGLGELHERARTVLAGEPAALDWPGIGVFAPVAGVKSRHECVLLPFKALERALAALPGKAS